MRCWFCGATDEHDFSLYHNNFICDDCLSVLNYHVNNAMNEIQEDHGTAESDFWEGIENYVTYRQDKYNEDLRKERMKQWQK